MDVADRIVVRPAARSPSRHARRDLRQPGQRLRDGLPGLGDPHQRPPVRPHDVEISTTPSTGAVEATVTRIVRLGFESGWRRRWPRARRVRPADPRVGRPVGAADGDTIYVRAADNAYTLPDTVWLRRRPSRPPCDPSLLDLGRLTPLDF